MIFPSHGGEQFIVSFKRLCAAVAFCILQAFSDLFLIDFVFQIFIDSKVCHLRGKVFVVPCRLSYRQVTDRTVFEGLSRPQLGVEPVVNQQSTVDF